MDIKEEMVEDPSSASPVTKNSLTAQTTTSLDKDKLNSSASNPQEIRKNRKEITKKPVSYQEINQIKTEPNDKKIVSGTTNNGQTKKNRDISFNKIEFSFPSVVNSKLVADGPQNIIIGNEEQIDNELNLKLINNKNRMKRTYSKVDNNKKTSSVSKIPKLHDKIKASVPIDESNHKQLNNTKNIKTFRSNLSTNNNECIIIDD